MQNLKTAVLVLSALAAAPCAFAFDLVGEQTEAAIIIPADAEDSTKYAADVLVEYVGKITGRKLKIENTRVPGRAEVVIGTLKTLKGLPADVKAKLDSAKQFEAGMVKAADDAIFIVGKETPGEHYAVCNFIETKLGVRWFAVPTPDDPGEYVPKAATLKISSYERFREPAFMERRLSMVGMIWYPIPKPAFEVLFRAGFQPMLSIGYPMPSMKSFWDKPEYAYFTRAHVSPHKNRIGGGHHLFGEVAPDKDFDKEPELHPLVDGKRVANHLHCFSNPELLQRVADAAIKKYDETNGDGQFLFGMADLTRGWCECEKCRALDPPGHSLKAKGNPDVSTRFSKVVNVMAEKIFAKYPNAEVVRWAYHTYRNLPVGVKHDPRMYFQYCTHGRCHGHTLDDTKCRRNQDFMKGLNDWIAFSGRGGFLYDYLCGNSDDHYCCCEKKEAGDIRLYAKLGMVGWKNEMQYEGGNYVKYVRNNPKRLKRANDVQASNWRYFYTTGRLLWEPGLDIDAMLDDVNILYYGVAAKPMMEYQNLRQQLWNTSSVCMGYPWGNSRTPQLLNDLSAKDRLFRLLDEGAKLAVNDAVVSNRIARDRAWLQEYWVEPNDKFRAKMGSEFKAPRPISPVQIDGIGDESAWSQAFYTDAFYKNNNETPDLKPIPAALKTTVGILADNDNFYLLVTAKEPNPAKMVVSDGVKFPAWSGDRMEFFFYPPNVENKYYQIAISPSGATYLAAYPGGEDASRIKVESKTVISKDQWVMELKIPAQEMLDLKSGDVWHVNFCRGRGFTDDISRKMSWTIDATGCHQQSEYRRIEIGEAYVVNGSFEDLDKNGALVKWGGVVPNTNYLQRVKKEDGSGYALKLGTRITQELTKGPFAAADHPRKISYELKAKGAGSLRVSFMRFTEKPGRRRVDPEIPGGKHKLTPEWATYSGEVEIPADEWVYIALRGMDGEVYVDDVLAFPVQK